MYKKNGSDNKKQRKEQKIITFPPDVLAMKDLVIMVIFLSWSFTLAGKFVNVCLPLP
jgi:hypothetical protein